MNDNRFPERVQREARLQWVPISEMRVSPLAQRDLNQARVDRLAASFDLEQLGAPTVSFRDGCYYIIDGQHRIEALKAIGYGDQQVQCWVYRGLSEVDEAEGFLRLNDTLAVAAYPKFKVAVQAGRAEEGDIDRIVRAQGLKVSLDRGGGAISAVHTLRRVYRRGGAACLARALRIARDAYGDPGFEAMVIDGIGLLCHRYNGELKEDQVIHALAGASGGVNGLLGKAENLRRQTGNPKAHCVAAAAVELINRKRGGRKLRSWWRSETGPADPASSAVGPGQGNT
jgi:ParB-like nuclease domain